jgi:hypothetical protein
MAPVRQPPDDGITDEALMMFADGKLDDAAMDRIANAIQADPALAARVAAFTSTRDLLKGAFSAPINEQPPERLIAAIMSGAALPQGAEVIPFKPRTQTAQAAKTPGWLPMALAAGIAGIAAGVGGFMIGQDRSRPETAVAALAGAGTFELAGLDIARDGQDMVFGPNLKGNVSGSYRMADRRICRTLSVRHGRSGSAADGVACQNAGSWRVELALPRDEASAVFRPASGTGPIDALLEAGGADAVLSARDVDDLIKRNWR